MEYNYKNNLNPSDLIYIEENNNYDNNQLNEDVFNKIFNINSNKDIDLNEEDPNIYNISNNNLNLNEENPNIYNISNNNFNLNENNLNNEKKNEKINISSSTNFNDFISNPHNVKGTEKLIKFQKESLENMLNIGKISANKKNSKPKKVKIKMLNKKRNRDKVNNNVLNNNLNLNEKDPKQKKIKITMLNKKRNRDETLCFEYSPYNGPFKSMFMFVHKHKKLSESKKENLKNILFLIKKSAIKLYNTCKN